jgi:ABC-type transport system involved in multi-copper enzyme maturation permease subunit
LFIGPVFTREAVTTPRRPRHYLYRTVYVAALLVLMCTAWLVVAGTQLIRNVGDMARFGGMLFQILAPLQLALVVFLSALHAASAVAQEKDKNTFLLLLMTRLRDTELVLGKLFASLLNVLVMAAAALPVFMFTVVIGGVSFEQVARVYAVTIGAALLAGSLGSTVALWREKTFQTLATTALVSVLWIGIWEAAGWLVGEFYGVSPAVALSPISAILTAARPVASAGTLAGFARDGVLLFAAFAALGTLLLNALAIRYVRIWNPSREVRRGGTESEGQTSIWGAEHDLAAEGSVVTTDREQLAEVARAGHVDARVKAASGKTREVWNNPILWREICTWAYGRKVLIIHAAYLLFFALALFGLHGSIASGAALKSTEALGTIIPAAATPLAPFFLISLVIVNALAVNSITNERDGGALDLLLVTDLTPKEFLFGKLGGVAWVARSMIVCPLVLCVYLWARGGLTLPNLFFLVGGLAVMNLFVAMLGMHCGMNYANSRTAITVSLGTVFFLFLGIATCMLMMVSFSGSFQTQLAPFLAFILGGSVGLYVALGSRLESPAIGVAAIFLPFATFYSITSYILEYTPTVFLVTVATYGFTTAAMMVPALSEFDFAMGRGKAAQEE